MTDIPENLPPGLSEALKSLMDIIERLNGSRSLGEKAMTYDDARDLGILDENYEKV